MNNCELCAFNNPKVTVTAIAIRDNKLLVLKRNEEPYRNMWDLPGGYMSAGEDPEETIRRELKEELGVSNIRLNYLRDIPSWAMWKDKTFAILAKFFLVDFDGEIKLNEENADYIWVPLNELDPVEVAFDSNQAMSVWVKDKFTFDLTRVEELLKQLDSSVVLDEQALYKSILCGHLEKIYDGELLIGMGWIYPRQTALRHQAVVEDMIVDAAYRGKGHGDALLVGLENWAKEQGVKVIELTSGYHRVAAHALYKRHDFRIHETAHMLKDI
jgi:8-oxo-dGTP pyrophosphatase MutT (NUDIX family)/GNAT superfamily N-acetyltransferase